VVGDCVEGKLRKNGAEEKCCREKVVVDDDTTHISETVRIEIVLSYSMLLNNTMFIPPSTDKNTKLSVAWVTLTPKWLPAMQCHVV